jgi:hypothetical protein
MESKILLDTIKLQHLFIESLYDIKKKDYYTALQKLDAAYTLFDELIQSVHPLSEIRIIILELRDKIEYNMKQIKGYVNDSIPIDNDIIYDKDIIDEITNEYPIELPEVKIDLFTCVTPIYTKINQTIAYFFQPKVKID